MSDIIYNTLIILIFRQVTLENRVLSGILTSYWENDLHFYGLLLGDSLSLPNYLRTLEG